LSPRIKIISNRESPLSTNIKNIDFLYPLEVPSRRRDENTRFLCIPLGYYNAEAVEFSEIFSGIDRSRGFGVPMNVKCQDLTPIRALEEMFEMFGINDILKFLESKPELVKKVSEMNLQKKESRLVINMPEWLKMVLQEKATQKGVSMNEIVRVAIIEYLSKGDQQTRD
jgi:hypothetical protein